MKVYMYGHYLRNGDAYIKVGASLTTILQEAFNECYIIGLDGLDYWLVSYDTDTDVTYSISITDAAFYGLWLQATENYHRHNVTEALKAEYV